MKRRQFLKKTLTGLSSIIIAPKIASALQSSPRYYDPCENVPLGNSGLKYSRICFGTGTRGWDQKSNQVRLGKEKFDSLIRYAYEKGIRSFDLADLYGTHPHVTSALKKIPRQNYQITSKIWFRPGGLLSKERPDADVVIPRFLKELNTDYIDLVLIHCATEPDWPNKYEKQMNILAKFKKKGIIRAHGISAHSIEALNTAADQPWLDSVHARINPYGTKAEPSEKILAVTKKLKNAGKGICAMKIIGEGKFTNSPEKIDASINFALNNNAADSLIVGFLKKSEIDDLAKRIKNTKISQIK